MGSQKEIYSGAHPGYSTLHLPTPAVGSVGISFPISYKHSLYDGQTHLSESGETFLCSNDTAMQDPHTKVFRPESKERKKIN